MPHKRIDELYNSIGFNKHGKTELYRSLLRHLERPDARFAFAEGDEGLVMCVFTLPSLNVVFKIIKDRFGASQDAPPAAASLDKYHFVFVRDRVGRLADAQEFEHLEFPTAPASPTTLLAHLREVARVDRARGGRTAWSSAHPYTERRVTPLNLYPARG